jgi:hypothetical protein
MGKHVKIGDRLEVEFAPARRGAQTLELINGRPAYAIDSGPAPLSGDKWEVMVVGMNPRRTVYFVEPLELVEAADGLSDLLRPHAPFYHEFIREAEQIIAPLLSDLSDAGAGDADEQAEAIAYIDGHCLLPDTYKASVSSRFEAMRVTPAAV